MRFGENEKGDAKTCLDPTFDHGCHHPFKHTWPTHGPAVARLSLWKEGISAAASKTKIHYSYPSTSELTLLLWYLWRALVSSTYFNQNYTVSLVTSSKIRPSQYGWDFSQQLERMISQSSFTGNNTKCQQAICSNLCVNFNSYFGFP